MKFSGRIEEFLKVSKKCEIDKQESCFAFKRTEGNISPSPDSSSYILADGTSLRMGFSKFERDGNRHWKIPIMVNPVILLFMKDSFSVLNVRFQCMA